MLGAYLKGRAMRQGLPLELLFLRFDGLVCKVSSLPTQLNWSKAGPFTFLHCLKNLPHQLSVSDNYFFVTQSKPNLMIFNGHRMFRGKTTYSKQESNYGAFVGICICLISKSAITHSFWEWWPWNFCFLDKIKLQKNLQQQSKSKAFTCGGQLFIHAYIPILAYGMESI